MITSTSRDIFTAGITGIRVELKTFDDDWAAIATAIVVTGESLVSVKILFRTGITIEVGYGLQFERRVLGSCFGHNLPAVTLSHSKKSGFAHQRRQRHELCGRWLPSEWMGTLDRQRSPLRPWPQAAVDPDSMSQW